MATNRASTVFVVAHYTAWYINGVIHGQSSVYVPEFHVIKMNPICHLAGCCPACTAIVNFKEPDFYITIMSLLRPTQVKLYSIEMSTMRWDPDL